MVWGLGCRVGSPEDPKNLHCGFGFRATAELTGGTAVLSDLAWSSRRESDRVQGLRAQG